MFQAATVFGLVHKSEGNTLRGYQKILGLIKQAVWFMQNGCFAVWGAIYTKVYVFIENPCPLAWNLMSAEYPRFCASNRDWHQYHWLFFHKHG